jgi:hypothetical protein
MPALETNISSQLELLLRRFLSEEYDVAREFDRVVRPLLTKYAKRYGWFLAEDKREEVVQQVFVLLAGPVGQTFNPDRGSAEGFLRFMARRAAREVGAMYTVPGTRTRPPKRKPTEKDSPWAPTLALDELEDEDIPRVDGPERAFEVRHDVAAVLAAAPIDVANALNVIYLQEVSVKQFAAEVSTSRYVVDRKIQKFAETFAAYKSPVRFELLSELHYVRVPNSHAAAPDHPKWLDLT